MSDTKKRTFKVWAIMAGDRCTGIAYPGSRRIEARDFECREGERPVAATLTLDPPQRRKPSKRSPR